MTSENVKLVLDVAKANGASKGTKVALIQWLRLEGGK